MFNLGAVGAGLGQFAEQYRQQQESALRQQQMKLQMAQFRQRQLEQQQQRQAQAALFGLAASGGLDQQPIPGQTLGTTGGGMRSGGDLGGGLRAGGALTGDPLDLIARYESGGKNIEQGVVGLGGGYNPSVGRVTGPSSASGPWQMIDPTWRKAAAAVGIDTNQYPRAITAPVELQRKAAQYLYDTEGFKPWAPYNANLRAALGRGGGPDVLERGPSRVSATLASNPGVAEQSSPDLRSMPAGGAMDPMAGSGGEYGVGKPPPPSAGQPDAGLQKGLSPQEYRQQYGQDYPAGALEGGRGAGAAQPATRSPSMQAPAAASDVMAPVQQEVRQGIQNVARITPPSVFGRMGIQGLAKQIEQAAPGADPAVKFMMLQEAQALLAPDAKMQWEAYKEQHNEDFQRQMAVFRDNLAEQAEKRREALGEQKAKALREQGGDVMTDPETGTQFVYNKYTKQATTLTGEPYKPSGAQRLAGAGGGSPLSADRARDLTTETARLDREWAEEHPRATAAEKQQAHFQNRAKAEKVLAEAKTGSGGMQAAQQMNRVTAAANLLSAELTNMSELPAMSTASIFQGVEALPGKHPGEAIKRSMAAAITPEDSTDLITSFQGVARAVAALETSGAATGLVGLTESARAYQPAATDTVGNIMRKFATLRQILERGLESSAAAKGVTDEQRALYEKIKKEVAQAVPFTVEDVTKLRRGDGETYKQLFERTRKVKEGAGAPPPATDAPREFTAPLPGAVENGYRFKGGDAANPENWERVQ
jgi:hypothetical protein